MRQLAAAAVQDGRQRPRAVVVADVDARPHLVARLREGVLVALVEPEEGRDVEPLAVLVAELRPAQHLGQALAEGVAQLGDHAGERAVGAVAPVEADRVEDVAEHARLGEHQDALDRRVAGELDHRLLQRRCRRSGRASRSETTFGRLTENSRSRRSSSGSSSRSNSQYETG